MAGNSSEFYVGYFAKAPAGLARRLRWTIAALGAIGLLAATVLVLAQSPFAASKFEWGVYREYRGFLEDWPYPTLITHDAHYLLVAGGKHGLAGFSRGVVTFQGSLIQRGNQAMLEVLPGSLRSRGGVSRRAAPVSLGQVRLTGEIVDSKCYLGVMNPGNGKVHRDCAARCISGGVPPAFLVRDAAGQAQVLLLVGAEGQPLSKELLDFVAEPVEIGGELLRDGPGLILKMGGPPRRE
jgi:hypothetical protein